MRKKLVIASIALFCLFGTTACSQQDDADITQSTESNTETSQEVEQHTTVGDSQANEEEKGLTSGAKQMIEELGGKTKDEYIKEMGVTKENSKIVMYYQYDNYVQYKVYEFEDTEYQLTIYDFYDNEESFLVPYNYAKKYDLDEYFDSTCYLHSYQEPITKGKREDAYAGVMYSIENQMKYSNNDFIFLVEKD